MQVRKTPPASVPDPETFRAWVQDCLALLGISAASVSRQLGLGRNTVGDFLAKPGRGISLTTAHVLTCCLRGIAHDRRVILPSLGGRANVE